MSTKIPTIIILFFLCEIQAEKGTKQPNVFQKVAAQPTVPQNGPAVKEPTALKKPILNLKNNMKQIDQGFKPDVLKKEGQAIGAKAPLVKQNPANLGQVPVTKNVVQNRPLVIAGKQAPLNQPLVHEKKPADKAGVAKIPIVNNLAGKFPIVNKPTGKIAPLNPKILAKEGVAGKGIAMKPKENKPSSVDVDPIKVPEKPIIQNIPEIPQVDETETVEGSEKEEDTKSEEEAQSTIDEYEEMDIIWEIGPLKERLVKEKKIASLEFLKFQIKLATSIIKHYVKVKKGYKSLIEVPEGTFCKTPIPHSVSYTTNLLIITRYIYEEETETIAQAAYCKMDKETRRAYVGVMEVNLYELIDEKASDLRKLNYLLTFVHEVFHIITFAVPQKEMFKTPIKALHTHLDDIFKSGKPVYMKTSHHWDETYLPNELMTETARHNRVLTANTLELIEHFSSAYRSDYSFMANNYALDNIDNYREFVNYQCSEEEDVPKYSDFFCSPKESKAEKQQCTRDYLYRTYCQDELPNKCFNKVAKQSGFCLDTSNKPVYEFETFGMESRCFGDKEGESYCLRYAIEEGTIQIYFGTEKYTCVTNGQEIQAKIKVTDPKPGVYRVTLICPNINDFIMMEKKTSCPEYCNGHGFCSDGNCLCFDGFSDTDYCKEELPVQKQSVVFTELLINRKK